MNPSQHPHLRIDPRPVEHSPGVFVRVLTLDRPDKRNALTPDLIDAVTHAVSRMDDGASSLLLTGEGTIFCSGFDMNLRESDPAALPAMLRGLCALITAIIAQPLPVVIAAHGGAVAGACALLGTGDVVITTSDAKIGYPVVRLNISPAVSGPTLVSQIGAGAARTRMLDTRLVSGEEAVLLGLAHEALPTREACHDRAWAIATALASKPEHAVRATRRLCWDLSRVDTASLEAALAASLSVG